MKNFRTSVMEFLKHVSIKNEKGEILIPQTEEMLTRGGGWKAIGYSLVATSPEIVPDHMWGKKRIVLASQGPQAIAEFDSWFIAGIEQGFMPVWRYYISHGRCVLDNSEFKNTIVYRHDTKMGSVLVEFVPMEIGGSVDMKLFAEVLGEEMDVKSAADEFLSLSQMIGYGARVLWTYSDDKNAA